MSKETVKAALTVALVFMLVGLLLGCLVCYFAVGRGRTDVVVERDTVTYVDTVKHIQPVVKDSMVVRYIKRYLPVAVARHQAEDTLVCDSGAPPQLTSDERDSAEVEIPITQQMYSGPDYRAWVSGYSASLDSIYVYPVTTVISERVKAPPRKWHIGVHAGYGYGFRNKHIEPFVGVGITYSLISF